MISVKLKNEVTVLFASRLKLAIVFIRNSSFAAKFAPVMRLASVRLLNVCFHCKSFFYSGTDN